MANPKVFFDIEIGGMRAGQIEMELFATDVPMTSNHFIHFCTGEMGVDKETNKPFHYRWTFFHRVVKGFVCQGGDFISNDGTHNKSYEQDGKFKPENYVRRHTGFGDLCMVVSRMNRTDPMSTRYCGSQFYISMGKEDHLDEDQVVFGKVVKGEDVVRKINNLGDINGKLSKPVQIVNCGRCA